MPTFSKGNAERLAYLLPTLTAKRTPKKTIQIRLKKFNLNLRKIAERTVISLRDVKDNAEVLAEYTCRFFSKSITVANFHIF